MYAGPTRHTLVESYVPAPLRIEKKPAIQTTQAQTAQTAVAQPQQATIQTATPPMQSTQDFVRRTDRSMARQQAQEAVMQQQQQQQQNYGHQPQQQQQQYAHQQQQQQQQYAHQQQQQPQYSLYQPRRPAPAHAPAHPHPHHSHLRGPNSAPFQWQRPALLKPTKVAPARPRAPGEMFAALPGEVLELILDELKKSHMEDGQSCATCWMRDACAMAVTARKMLKYARVALYEGIELAGAEAVHARHAPKAKKLKSPKERDEAAQQQARRLLADSRLSLLLRTLEASPPIAAIVRTLRVPPAFASDALLTAPTASVAPVAADAYEALVASVVQACPNLERVLGYYPAYDHNAAHGRYAAALASRTRLKEMTWVVAPLLSQEQREQHARAQREHDLQQQQQPKPRARGKSFSHMRRPVLLPSPPVSPRLAQDDGFAERMRPRTGSPDADGTPFSSSSSSSAIALAPRQSARFLNHHIHWQYLSTLAVHCLPGATLTPSTLLVDALMYLPALQNLYLSHLPAAAFDDASLLALPPLKKLALVHLPGVTAQGLSTLATRGTSRSLTDVSLVHVGDAGNMPNLPALARLLSKLDKLTSLSLVQAQAPALPSGDVIWLFPYLASPSLEKLHWDVPTPTPVPAAAAAAAAAPSESPFGAPLAGDVVLARSIAAQGFPRLRQLRTPNDPEGLFQALCRPQERVVLAKDRYRGAGTTYPSAFTSPAGTTSTPPSAAGGHRQRDSESSLFSASFGTHSRTNSTASFTFGKSSAASSPSSSPSSSSTSSAASSASSASSTASAPPTAEWTCTHLGAARVAAQARIDASRRAPRMLVHVTDEHGRLVDQYGLAGFVGTVGSPITYHLLPDTGASDEKGGLVDVHDVLCGGGAGGGGAATEADDAVATKNKTDKKKEATSDANASIAASASSTEGCTGQWNANWELPQKKDRARWWHTERPRPRAVTLF
ncbi:hypothetical protein HMPREF1624_07652 [Sporothrix schenckii ATCC 58251]|uniref:F-box domain-containing protein n=1 Tax=Sporothrix schenckii (strain ATCC 58251 / de Perez 2211183) TaxID=1391915 RepID=U7PMF9_SPOS1|nr:hypothetical protein HMPREF1624_07652 [Sporothrix schenckii ATCC 58251]